MRPSGGPKVLAAMSGGVDSSVATALLVEAGFEVVGSMLRFWSDDRPEGAFDACCSPEAAFDARRIADRLDVPFYLLDAREAFDRVVIDPFVPGYEAGETPNPCVWCNREIKFGDFVRRAQRLGCEFMATGHYVRRVDGRRGPELHRGRDDDKDQTYFLWALPREILPYLLFPLGEMTKPEVRQEAVKRGLSVAWKASSSGLCFIPDTVKGYLEGRAKAEPGPVVDASADFEVVGEHAGVPFYTIGQKRGLGLWRSHVPRYVIDVEPATNTVVVGPREMCRWRELVADRMNLLCDPAELPERVWAQVRYRQSPVAARLARRGDDGFSLTFDEPQFAVARGQSAVLYDGERLLGGGVIVSRGDGGASHTSRPPTK
ncbi:tRNA 2-thiouridine(34) synthase MnmA [soil metagenome]|nr:tRNA 2-thiouridine(34) synthase MnmA [Trueperaceae bacterium]